MTTSSHCNTGRMCVTLPIIITEKLPYLYTLLTKSQYLMWAENRKIRGLKFVTL